MTQEMVSIPDTVQQDRVVQKTDRLSDEEIRDISLRYLFHLKVLEYAKSNLIKKIDQNETDLKNLEIDKGWIAKLTYIPETVGQPRLSWSDMNWSGKWLILLGLGAFLVLLAYVSQRIANMVGNSFRAGICVLFMVIPIISSI